MADTKIRGITIELGADYTQVTDAFKNVVKELSGVSKSLKDVNKLLKLDPTNTKLLAQKQGYLEDAIALTTQKLEEEKKMLEALPKGEGEEQTEQQKALAREIEATNMQLQGYKTQLENTQKAQEQASASADKLEKEVDEAGKSAGNAKLSFKDFASVLTGINQGAELVKKGIQMVSGAYDALIGDTVELADNLMTQSSVTGLSTDQLQEYAYMAELVDTDVSTITGSLTKLTNNMQSASNGTGDAYKAFQQLGIDVTNADGSLRDANDVFGEAIDKLGEMENQTERDALTMDIFGKSGKELNPIIDAGSEAIEGFRKEAYEMGYVLDNDTLEALGGIDDSMQRLKNTGDAVKNQIAVALAPVISEITTAFVEWAQSVDWQKVGEVIGDVITDIVGAIKWLIDIIKDVIEWIGKAIDIAKDFFQGKWELPHIKLPHPYISPRGWSIGDLLKGVVPKIAIDWYAKGYDGMVLDGATIFGMNKSGQLMAGGERGREIIIGENKLAQMLNSKGQMVVNITVNEANNAEATAEAVMNRMQLAVATEGSVWR